MIKVVIIYLVCCVSTCNSLIRSQHVTSKHRWNNHNTHMSLDDPYTAVMIIPTGVGASIGGYAGDGLPSAKLLSSVVDILITHPNVMNGANMYWPIKNILYVEGYALDEFSSGHIGLQPIVNGGQKIGLLLDKAIESNLRHRHLQVADAAKATLGINIAECVVTSKPVNVVVKDLTEGGASWGSIENIDSLLEAAEVLYKKGCTAIAVVVRFPEDDEGETKELSELQIVGFQLYRQGEGVDRIAGAEAIISHLITKKLMIPCAHAPAFDSYPVEPGISPKACAEEIGYTYLPCVLSYLHKAPNLIKLNDESHKSQQYKNILTSQDVSAVVVPINALGGPTVLSFLAQGKLIIAVEENETAMKLTPSDLLPLNDITHNNVIIVRSYAEAVGYLVAHKNGILFEAITSKVQSVPVTEL